MFMVRRIMDDRASHRANSPSTGPGNKVGRRNAARLRLSVPAQLVSRYDTRRCILLDLSRTGAQVWIDEPLSAGEALFLKIAGIEAFGTVTRRIARERGASHGIVFDDPISDDEVLKVRAHAEVVEIEERRALRKEARTWVRGQ